MLIVMLESTAWNLKIVNVRSAFCKESIAILWLSIKSPDKKRGFKTIIVKNLLNIKLFCSRKVSSFVDKEYNIRKSIHYVMRFRYRWTRMLTCAPLRLNTTIDTFQPLFDTKLFQTLTVWYCIVFANYLSSYDIRHSLFPVRTQT